MGCSSTTKANPNTIKKNPQPNTNPQSAPANSNPTNVPANNTTPPVADTKPTTVDPKPQVVQPLPPQVLTGVHALYDLGIPTSKSIYLIKPHGAKPSKQLK